MIVRTARFHRFVCALLIAAPLAAAPGEIPPAPGEAAFAAQVAEAEAAFQLGDVVAAMSLLRRPAEQGYVPAQVQLAYYLDYAEEDEAAFRWYKMAADAGDPEAQFTLAKLFSAGEGTERNPERALEWLRRAGENAYVPAIRALALSYEQGGDLTRISFESAVEWLQRGAMANDIWSLRRLAQAYERGELGLRIDRAKAASLTNRATNLRGSDQ